MAVGMAVILSQASGSPLPALESPLLQAPPRRNQKAEAAVGGNPAKIPHRRAEFRHLFSMRIPQRGFT